MVCRWIGIALFFGALMSSGFAFAASSDSWHRDTAISPDGAVILFTHRGDIYQVSATGGVAVPLTSSESVEAHPVWSPDGNWIAFTSDRHGNLDVFVMPSAGGTEKRLTFHSSNDSVSGFSSDGQRVLFSSARYDKLNAAVDPHRSQPELYEVALNGGTPTRITTLFVRQARWSTDGSSLLFADDKREAFHRKHDDSPFERNIWRMTASDSRFEQLTTNRWNDHTPAWDEAGNGFYFISERSGTLNVWHQDFEGGEDSARQITSHDTHPVRDLSVSDRGDITYNFHGQVYFGSAGNLPAPVDVSILTRKAPAGPQRISANEKISEFVVSPDGKEIAYVTRGNVFVTALEFETTRQITFTPGEERSLAFTSDGRRLLYASERMDQWKIYESALVDDTETHFFLATRIKESLLVTGAERDVPNSSHVAATHPLPSPDGKLIAYLSDWSEIRVFDRKKQQSVSVVDADLNYSMGNNDIGYTWSPDSQWLAVDIQQNGRLFFPNIAVVPADGSTPPANLTRSGYSDAGPDWHSSGGIITWQTGRFGPREHGGHGTQYDVYAQFLTQDAWDEFRRTKEEVALSEPEEEDEKKEDDKSSEPVIVKVDLARAADRQARLTIHSSDLAGFALNKDGSVLYYLSSFEEGYDLWSHDFREEKTSRLVAIGANRASLELLADDSAAVVLADGKLMNIPLKGDEPAAEPVAVSATQDQDAEAERLAMLHHVWQTTHDRIYEPDVLAEARWDEMYLAYAAKVPGVGNNRDFSELVDELVGELNVSHAAARYRGTAGDVTAAMGAILDHQNTDKDGITIAHVLTQGPLAEASDRASAGNRIVAVNDRRLTNGTNYYELLANRADQRTRVTLVDNKGEFDVILRPGTTAAETAWLQEQWIESRHALVEKLSAGRLGYVYIPEMSDDSYRRVYSDVFGRHFDKEAIVIDVRDNNGGDLVDWLVQLFSGTQYMTNIPNGRVAQGEPITEWVKPSIALTNQGAYSDGHCFVAAWKNLGVSTLVGTPVAGTCTYAGWESLTSGDVRAGTPRLGIKDPGGDWLERKTTYPDVQVDIDPQSIEAGRDNQLERAVEVLLQELDGSSP